ncbi:MAG: hypothetical protein NTW12_07890 [Deltaproteobacteria bacterium]|nr:hypothetical protein [Deltaproteobacteria bacterium]
MNKTDDRKVKYGITIAALLIALAHLIWPTLTIDAITLTLFFIALIPWLSPLFKSLKFPGGLEIQFQDFKEKMETIIAKETEPADEATGATFSINAFSVNDEATRLVMKALGNPNYTWRYSAGLTKETKLPLKEILASIAWLLENKLVTESTIRGQRQWALSQEGRDLLSSILRADDTLKAS